MTRPFESERDTPVWQICYDTVAATEVGMVITYAEICEKADCSRSVAQAAMIRANKVLENNGLSRTRVKVNVGWVVITPAEALEIARAQWKKTGRAAGRHQQVTSGVNRRRGELTHEQRADADAETRNGLVMGEIFTRRARSARTLAEQAKDLGVSPVKRLRDA